MFRVGADLWQPAAVSVSSARCAVEAQRAEHDTARRRVQTLEEENHALRRSEAEEQVCCLLSLTSPSC